MGGHPLVGLWPETPSEHGDDDDGHDLDPSFLAYLGDNIHNEPSVTKSSGPLTNSQSTRPVGSEHAHMQLSHSASVASVRADLMNGWTPAKYSRVWP